MINEARRLIINLSQPLAEIAQNIERNLIVLHEHQKIIQEKANEVDALKNELYIP